MSLLAKRSVSKEDKSNIITLGKIAKKHKKLDPDVSNATVGMLYNEKGKLVTFDVVNKALNELSDEQKYAYAPISGTSKQHKAIKKWVFQDFEDEIEENLFVKVVATPGGSGAISNTFKNYLNKDEAVLLPNHMWGNYKQFAYENYLTYQTYSLFDDNNNFNLTSVKEKMIDLKNKQGRILLVINDPCHNPTGYSMKDKEWEELIDIINELSNDKTPIIILHDIAYIDYDNKPINETRKNLCLYKKLNKSVLVVLTFSASKSFGLYGVRVGAQVALSKKKEHVDEFKKASKFSSRASWSNTTNLGLNIVSKIITTEEYKQEYINELNKAKEILAKRATTFLDECKKVGLVTLPFVCGFFITIPCNNAYKAYDLLVERKIHIIPLNGCIRVTIASLTLPECIKLPGIIKEVIDLVNN